MEQISQIVGPVVNILTTYITRQLRYVTSTRNYVRDMANKMTVLEGKRDDVQKHRHTNSINNKETPARVDGWLGEVENVKKEAQSISSNVNGCLNIKMRYRLGRNAFKTIKEIEHLINEEIYWRDTNIPTGRVYTKWVSSSAPSASGEITQSDFKSRDKTFKDALRFLQQDDKASQVIALCGMGGVGKTTMMEQLKKVADDKKMFDWIVKVVIGNNPSILTIQNDIALCTGDVLPEATKDARAELLCRRFKKILENGTPKILVILDDVWEKLELKDIGLTSPLPNGVRLLITSRDSNICTQIAAGFDLVLQLVRVDVLEEAEAQSLFYQITGLSKEDDYDLFQIGSDIVKKCGFLPLAIKLIGMTLKSQENFVWRNTLNRLKNNDFDINVQEIIKISYEHIKYDDDKEIFLHCGLFPEDYNIPIEHLTRYAWGLNLLKNVSTLSEARDRTYTCVQNLINANLLINSDHLGCVKMHDLVLAFVLGRVSKGNPTWIINHGDISKWGRDKLSESCRNISLTCRGMSKFPRDFKDLNPSLLQLMYGDLPLKFPNDFYENIENLEVIAYYRMQYPLLPRSLQCSTRLRTLVLHECKLMFDFSFVGDLLNLEVLSFAQCGIRKLPSKIGNLKRLRILDLTGCVDLHIDDGALKNLHNLVELYMRVGFKKVIRFTNANFEELEMLSSQLCALEVEFVEKNWMKNVSFKKLDKFKISIGCVLEVQEDNKKHSFENTLKLVTGSSHLLDFEISELFKKTEKLHLQVEDMIRLEDVSYHPYNQHSFFYLKDLVISDCPKLIHLFPSYVASGLRKLERLKVSSCLVLEALVHGDGSEIKNSSELIKFEQLKYLSLKNLPKLVCMFLIDNVVDLPQLVELEVDGLPNFTSIYSDKHNTSAILNSQVNISELKVLKISSMKNLNQILNVSNQSSEEDFSNIFLLREIEVFSCDSLLNLFPTNPMRLLKHLETLKVYICGSIEVIFDIDLGCVGEVEEICNNSLRRIIVRNSKKVRGVWSIKCGEHNSSTRCSVLINSFKAVESIEIGDCDMFRNVFALNNTKFDMRAVEDNIYDCGESGRNKEEEVNVISNDEIAEVVENVCNVAFPSYQMPTFPRHLSSLSLWTNKRVKVVFEMRNGESETPLDTQQQILLLPNLKELYLIDMVRMTHVWKCDNWNKFSILQNQSSFQSLTTIKMQSCSRIKYLFSPLMAKFLSNLKNIEISRCADMEEVVPKRDDKDEEMARSTVYTTTNLFPHLHSLTLGSLTNLKCIGGGGAAKNKFFKVGDVSWSLCQFSKDIYISSCDALSCVIPSYGVGQMQNLQVLRVYWCESLSEVFETTNNSDGDGSSGGDGSSTTNIDERNGNIHTTTLSIPRIKDINVPQVSCLKKLVIESCNLLHHVFTFSSLESLRQLEELTIWACKSMEIIVKKENGEHRQIVVFPRLKSLELLNLPNLRGFFLGMNDFHWLLLEKAMISKCPQMMVFTSGQSIAPALKYIHTSLGKHSLECGLNFHVTRDLHQTPLPSSECTNLCSTSLERLPWSFHNLIELQWDRSWSDVNCIIPSNELLQLRKLERIRVDHCSVVEVFEVTAIEGTNSESHQIPNLTLLELKRLHSLEYIWKSNHHVLELPNLTTVDIYDCHRLKHVFSSSMVGSLLQLQHLHVSWCPELEVIVKVQEEFESDVQVKEIVLPCLISMKLESLSRFKGFCLGNADFSCPSLHTLDITACKQLTVFTKGHVATPVLNIIDTSFGRCYLTEDINSFITKNKQCEGFEF